jgi:hypothetical protein
VRRRRRRRRRHHRRRRRRRHRVALSGCPGGPAAQNKWAIPRFCVKCFKGCGPGWHCVTGPKYTQESLNESVEGPQVHRAPLTAPPPDDAPRAPSDPWLLRPMYPMDTYST